MWTLGRNSGVADLAPWRLEKTVGFVRPGFRQAAEGRRKTDRLVMSAVELHGPNW